MGRPPVDYPRRIRRRLIDGSYKDYYYDRKTGRPVSGPQLEAAEIPLYRPRMGARWGVMFGPEMSVAALIGHYQSSPEWAALALATQELYDRALARPDLQPLMRLKVAELTAPRMQRIRQAIVESGQVKRGRHATGAANVFTGAVAALYTWGRANRGIGELYPTRGLKTYPVQRGHELWSAEDIDAWVRGAPQPQARAIRLGLATAARISDLIRLTWDQYDAQAGGIRLTPMKTKRFRQTLLVPAPPEMGSWRNGTDDGAIILRNPAGEPWTDVHAFDRAMLRARVAHDLPARTMHGLRATGASWLIELGVPQRSVMALTGHTSEKSFLAYIRYADQKKIVVPAADAMRQMLTVLRSAD